MPRRLRGRPQLGALNPRVLEKPGRGENTAREEANGRMHPKLRGAAAPFLSPMC